MKISERSQVFNTILDHYDRKMLRHDKFCTLGFWVLCMFFNTGVAYAQLSINTISTPYIVDFDNTVAGVNNGQYNGSGFEPIPGAGRLDSDAFIIDADFGTMNFGDVQTGGAYARGLNVGAGVNTGGIYACGGGSITGNSVGFEPSANYYTPGRIIMRVVNNTGATVDQLNVQYELHVRNDQGRSTTVSFSHSADNFGYISEPAADYTSVAPSSGSAFFLGGTMNLTLRCVNLQPGDFYYLRWVAVDAGGSGNRDEFGIDNIQVTAEPFFQPVYYSRNSGNQTSNIGTCTQLWATTPGGVGSVQYPLDRCANYVVQNGDTVTLTASGQTGLTINDLEVEPGGRLVSNTVATTPRYLNIRGDILCNGDIGNGNGNVMGNGIAFNIEDGAHTISGTGTFDCSRMRKSDVNGMSSPTDLVIDMDLDCHITTAGIYNNFTGNSMMNVTIATGVNVSMARFAIDGGNGGGLFEAGGSLIVDGTLNLSSFLYPYNSNTINSTSVTVSSTGRLNVAGIWYAASGVAGSSLVVDPGGHLDITGAAAWITLSFVNNSVTFAPGSTVEYSAGGAQVVRSIPTHGNLILSGSGNRTLSGADLNVVNDLTITGGTVLIPGLYDIYLGGNWTSYSAVGFNEGTSTVTFNGTMDQYITCSGAEEYYQLVLDKPISGDVYLNDGIGVANNLDLIDGNIYITGKKLDISNNPTATGITRTNGMVIAEDPTFFGHIIWDIQANTQAHVFPFGRPDGTYLPMTVQLISGNAGEVRGSTYPTPPDNLPWPTGPPVAVLNLNSWIGLLPDNRDATVDRFWLVGVQNTGVVMDLSLSYADNELPIPPYNNWTQIEAQAYNDVPNEWQPGLPGQIQTALVGAYEVYVPSVNPYLFSPWTFAPTFAPLPIELITFNALPRDQVVDLEWSTASETNNDLFTLERSKDALEFQAIGFVAGAVNSSSQIDYQFQDTEPMSGLSYYRLKQTDLDGTFSYSEIRAVDRGNSTNDPLNVWSDPNGVQIQHGATGEVEFVVRDVLGRELFSRIIVDPAQRFNLELPPRIERNAVLFLSMQQNGQVETVRFYY